MVLKRICWEILTHTLTLFINMDCSSLYFPVSMMYGLVFWYVEDRGYRMLPGLVMINCIFIEF